MNCYLFTVILVDTQSLVPDYVPKTIERTNRADYWWEMALSCLYILMI